MTRGLELVIPAARPPRRRLRPIQTTPTPQFVGRPRHNGCSGSGAPVTADGQGRAICPYCGREYKVRLADERMRHHAQRRERLGGANPRAPDVAPDAQTEVRNAAILSLKRRRLAENGFDLHISLPVSLDSNGNVVVNKGGHARITADENEFKDPEWITRSGPSW
jgi:hypothetical protein